MLRTRVLLPVHRTSIRCYASSPSPSALVYLEHHDGDIDIGSLSALTAAGQLGGRVTAVVVGKAGYIESVVEKAKK
jgi:electron transfer flavoprotein alpha subunit